MYNFFPFLKLSFRTLDKPEKIKFNKKGCTVHSKESLKSDFYHCQGGEWSVGALYHKKKQLTRAWMSPLPLALSIFQSELTFFKNSDPLLLTCIKYIPCTCSSSIVISSPGETSSQFCYFSRSFINSYHISSLDLFLHNRF